MKNCSDIDIDDHKQQDDLPSNFNINNTESQ